MAYQGTDSNGDSQKALDVQLKKGLPKRLANSVVHGQKITKNGKVDLDCPSCSDSSPDKK